MNVTRNAITLEFVLAKPLRETEANKGKLFPCYPAAEGTDGKSELIVPLLQDCITFLGNDVARDALATHIRTQAVQFWAATEATETHHADFISAMESGAIGRKGRAPDSPLVVATKAVDSARAVLIKAKSSGKPDAVSAAKETFLVAKAKLDSLMTDDDLLSDI